MAPKSPTMTWWKRAATSFSSTSSRRPPLSLLEHRRCAVSFPIGRDFTTATTTTTMRAAAPILRVKKLTDLAIIPSRGSTLAAGFDLSSAYDAVIPARGKGLVKTDLVVAVPDGCYARVAPRSGLALKKFIDTGAGVIDADYRGNVGVILFNHADEDFEVKRGDRVAQLILEKIEYADISVVEEIEETDRGAGGFGSTGVENPLKRVRQPESPLASSEPDAVFEALELLFAGGAIDGAKRVQVKKAAFAANERQFNLLNKALNDYLTRKDQAKALEWIDAFLAQKAKDV